MRRHRLVTKETIVGDAVAERTRMLSARVESAEREASALRAQLAASEAARQRAERAPDDAATADVEEWIRNVAEDGSSSEAGDRLRGAYAALRAEATLLTHKAITCGVAASHPDPNLSRRGAYGGTWDSPQAEDVRQLRARATAAEASLAALRERVEGLAKEWETEADRRDREADARRRGDRLALRTGAAFERGHAIRLRALSADETVEGKGKLPGNSGADETKPGTGGGTTS